MRSRKTHLILASLTFFLGLAKSSLSLALCSVSRRSFSSAIDCLCGLAGIISVGYLMEECSNKLLIVVHYNVTKPGNYGQAMFHVFSVRRGEIIKLGLRVTLWAPPRTPRTTRLATQRGV